jgi:hypothetical protein
MPLYVFHCSCGSWHSGAPREPKAEASAHWVEHVKNSPARPTGHLPCLEIVREFDEQPRLWLARVPMARARACSLRIHVALLLRKVERERLPKRSRAGSRTLPERATLPRPHRDHTSSAFSGKDGGGVSHG